MSATLLKTRKANDEAFQAFMATVRAALPKACAACAFWGGEPREGAPERWRRCKKSGRTTAPSYSCTDFVEAR